MATQFSNKATSNVVVDGQTVNFSSNTVVAELFDSSSVTLVKSQNTPLVVSGGTITYTVVITNLALTPVTNFNFLDTIPTGMSYKTGTFTVNGTSQSPTVTGQNLSYVITTLATGVTTVVFECDVA